MRGLLDDTMNLLFLVAAIIFLIICLSSCGTTNPSRNMNDMTPQEICKEFDPAAGWKCEVL